MSHFLHSLGWLPEREPFRRLLVQGMVMGRSYRVKGSGKYLKPEEIDFSGQKPVEAATGNALVVTWEKMSKSKFNGVEPETVWNEQGIDTTRLLILADVSPRASRNWSKDSKKTPHFCLAFHKIIDIQRSSLPRNPKLAGTHVGHHQRFRQKEQR